MKIKELLIGLVAIASVSCGTSKTLTEINFDSSKGSTPVTLNENKNAICKCYEEAEGIDKEERGRKNAS